MNQDLSRLGWMGQNENVESKSGFIENGKAGIVQDKVQSGISEIPESSSFMFDISSTKIIEDEGPDKKYVVYTISVRHGSARADLHATSIDRRYTDFLKLYEELKNEFPEIMTLINFPKKAIMGNFNEKLIKERSERFRKFLQFVGQDTKLKNTDALGEFLKDKELKQAMEWCNCQRYDLAEPQLKSIFRLLNKVYTDRTPVVLLALCRLVSCYAAMPVLSNSSAERWATLALHRYEGVSDIDLLQLYGPLLETCIEMWKRMSLDNRFLTDRLSDMKRRGMNLKNKCLLEVVEEVEARIKRVPKS